MRLRELRKLVQQLSGTGLTLADVQDAINSGTLVVAAGGGGGSPSSEAHDWVSNGDTNGLFYALGLMFGTDVFVNPVGVGGPVVATTSGALASDVPVSNATDRTTNLFHSTGNVPNNWCKWDFIGRSVVVRGYTLKSRSDSGLTWPTHWLLQGSNDGTTWTDLDEVTVPGWSTTNEWQHYVCDNVPVDPFRYIRIIDPTDTYFVFGEIELYGDLVTN